MRLPLSLLLFIFALPTLPATDAPLLLRGSNGTEIEVFGILEAKPTGLMVKIEEDDPLITIPWDKLDLDYLQSAQPDVYYACRNARITHSPILIKMGGFAHYVTFEEAITRLYQGMQRQRFYSIPENVDYLFEDDPDIMRLKVRDFARYLRTMRELRRELQEFFRQIFPRESIIIDDSGKVHRKERHDLTVPDKGETSLRIITENLADTRSTISRIGVLYLREVSLYREDFHALTSEIRREIPNETFRYGNANHMKLPSLIDESREAIDHFMDAKSYHRGHQYKLGEFYNFIYGLADEYEIRYQPMPDNNNDFPRLKIPDDF